MTTNFHIMAVLSLVITVGQANTMPAENGPRVERATILGSSDQSRCSAPIELHGGSSRCSGLLRVDVTGDPDFPGQSGYFSACHSSFSDEARDVVCRQLGCGNASTGASLSISSPDDRFKSFNYNCQGDEATLCQCSVHGARCGPSNTITIQCFSDLAIGNLGNTNFNLQGVILAFALACAILLL